MTSPLAIDAAVDDPLKVEALASKKSAAQEARKAHLLLQPHFLSPTPKCAPAARKSHQGRSEEHTSALPSLMRISYAVPCSKKHKATNTPLTPESPKSTNTKHEKTKN